MSTSSIELPLVKSVTPFDPEAQRAFLEDISTVLRKHKMLDRIGLCLLHKHYDLSADEILVETTDVQGRVSTTRPVGASSTPNHDLLETMWKLDDGGKAKALQYCGRCP